MIIMYVNKTEVCKLKLINFFSIDEISEISLNSTVYDFSVDQSITEEKDILILMKKE